MIMGTNFYKSIPLCIIYNVLVHYIQYCDPLDNNWGTNRKTTLYYLKHDLSIPLFSEYTTLFWVNEYSDLFIWLKFNIFLIIIKLYNAVTYMSKVHNDICYDV